MAKITADIERTLARNLLDVRERIDRALDRAGRVGEDITLVAVTKTVGPEVVDMLWDLGVRDIGENRIQPAEAKAPNVRNRFAWHMIGHLQRNKVRRALKLFSSIHSIDSIRLANKVDQEARLLNLAEPIPLFLQINVTASEKYGLSPDEAEAVLTHCRTLGAVQVQGLMTMAPYFEDGEKARPFFAALRGIRTRLADAGLVQSDFHLSMGMSGDFEVALEEGATLVRVGTALYRDIA